MKCKKCGRIDRDTRCGICDKCAFPNGNPTRSRKTKTEALDSPAIVIYHNESEVVTLPSDDYDDSSVIDVRVAVGVKGGEYISKLLGVQHRVLDRQIKSVSKVQAIGCLDSRKNPVSRDIWNVVSRAAKNLAVQEVREQFDRSISVTQVAFTNEDYWEVYISNEEIKYVLELGVLFNWSSMESTVNSVDTGSLIDKVLEGKEPEKVLDEASGFEYKTWTVEELDALPIGTVLVEKTRPPRAIIKVEAKPKEVEWHPTKEWKDYDLKRKQPWSNSEWYAAKYIVNVLQSRHQWALLNGSDVSEMASFTKTGTLSLSKGDKKLLDAYTSHNYEDASPNELITKSFYIDGEKLYRASGTCIASWEDNGKLYIVDDGTRSAQTVWNFLKKNTPTNQWGGYLKSRDVGESVTEGKDPTWMRFISYLKKNPDTRNLKGVIGAASKFYSYDDFMNGYDTDFIGNNCSTKVSNLYINFKAKQRRG